LELLHEYDALGTTVPDASRAVATTCVVCPTVSDVAPAERVIVATGPGPPPDTPMLNVPVTPSEVASIVAEPLLTAVTTPFALTVATAVFVLRHEMMRPVSTCPDASRTATVTCVV
jgi:hypothetical protein